MMPFEICKLNEQLIDLKVFKHNVLSFIEKQAQNALQDKTLELIIYYTGHGQKKTGNWICAEYSVKGEKSDHVISLKEVIEKI